MGTTTEMRSPWLAWVLSVVAVAAATRVVAAPDAADAEYLYRAEFDDGKAYGWQLRPSSRWTFEHGALVQENLDAELTPVYGLGHRSWRHFEIRTRIKFLRPRIDPDKAATLAIKTWHERTDLWPNGVTIWYKKPGETRSSAVHWRDKDAAVDPEHWYDVAVEYHPSRITVRVDGKTVAELAEVAPPPDGKPITIYFRNVKCALDWFRVIDREPPGPVQETK